jgi:hypothetical protein
VVIERISYDISYLLQPDFFKSVARPAVAPDFLQLQYSVYPHFSGNCFTSPDIRPAPMVTRPTHTQLSVVRIGNCDHCS